MKITFFRIFILSSLCILSACKKPVAKNLSPNNDSSTLIIDTLEIRKENSQITAYRTFLNTLDSTKAESALLALTEFKRMFNGKSVGLCDSAYVLFQEQIDTIELKLNEKLQNDTVDYSFLFQSGRISPKLLKAKNELFKNGFEFKLFEGVVYIVQNRNFIIRNLRPMLSESLQAYLLQIGRENNEGFMEDASIIISPLRHVDRILWYEKFIAENADFVYIKNCKEYKKAYLTYLLIGIDQTYLFEDDKSMKLTPYFSEAYAYLLKTYPKSETATLVLPYTQAIEHKQKMVVDELIKKYVIKGLIYSQKFE